MLRWGVVIGLILALSACGPEQSTLDQQRLQQSLDSQQQKAQLDSIAGDYCGSMAVSKTTSVHLLLHLREFSILEVNTSQNQVIEIPSLMGVMSEAGSDESAVSWSFNQGTYDKNNSTLVIIGASAAVNGTNGTASSPSATTYMKLKRIGSKFTGEFLSARLYSSNVTFTPATKGTDCQ